MAKIKRAKNVPKPFVLEKPTTIQNNLDNNFDTVVQYGVKEF
jgi:hypothetical protein